MKRTILSRTAIAAAAALAPGMLLAHPGHGTGFPGGILHPLMGADHLVAMVGVGLWAASLGGRARWALPATFLSLMALGAGLAMQGALGPLIAAVEPMILVSILLLGAVVTLSLRAPLALVLPLVALFGAAHGAAHGAEGVGTGFAMGMLATTAALHVAGLAFGLLANQTALRLAGAAVLTTALVMAV